MMTDWKRAQEWERNWWGNCANTYGEEEKQLLYAEKMGLNRFKFHDGKSPYNFDLSGISVLDFGGGPCSLLLKCRNVRGAVIDPLDFPEWVRMRYQLAEIEFFCETAEGFNGEGFDEAWLYNVLQHVIEPEQVIRNAKKAAKLLRVFEWIDTPTNEGHPHALSERWLNTILDGEGKVEQLAECSCYGRAYYGIFIAQ